MTMTATRREEILRAYMGHVRRFREVASRSERATGWFPSLDTVGSPFSDRDADPAPCPIKAAELSGRRLEVLSLIAEGLSNREIASGLQISEETVKSHIENILRLLDASNRANAVGIGYVRGLLGEGAPGPSLPLARAA